MYKPQEGQHEKSRFHQNAVEVKQTKELPLGETPAEKAITTLHAKDEEKLRNLFVNCHGLAYQGRPYSDFLWLLRMDKMKKVNVGDTCENDKKAREFTKAIAQIEKVIDRIASTKFTAVLVDGYSDVTVIENENCLHQSVFQWKSKDSVYSFCSSVQRSSCKYHGCH